MSIQFEKAKDLETIKKELEDTAVRYKKQLEFVNAMFEVLEKFSGKPITKRIATACEKHQAFEGYTVVLNTDYGMYHLAIWGKDVAYDQRFNALLGHRGSSDLVNLELIKKHNTCYTLNAERLENMKKTAGRVEGLVKRWNKAFLELLAIHEEASEVEGLEYKLDLKC